MDIRIVAYNLGENNALFACLGFVFCNGFCLIVQNSCTIDILQLELVLAAFFLFLFYLRSKIFSYMIFWQDLVLAALSRSRSLWKYLNNWKRNSAPCFFKIFKKIYKGSLKKRPNLLFKSVWCWSDFLQCMAHFWWLLHYKIDSSWLNQFNQWPERTCSHCGEPNHQCSTSWTCTCCRLSSYVVIHCDSFTKNHCLKLVSTWFWSISIL